MSKKSQADKVAAMLGKAQAVARPSNLPDEEKAAKPEGRQDVEAENRQTGKIESEKVDRITVGVKARKEIAYHWTIQGKLKRRSVSDVVRDALVAEFGLPDGFTKKDI